MRTARTLLVGTAIAALLATGCEWNFQTLDGHQDGPNGRINADVGQQGEAILYNGRPHVFYHDLENNDLRHAYFNGQFWAFETLDGAGGPNGRVDGNVGRNSAAVLYNGRPHVFYYDNATDDLRHGYWNGLFWAFETLDGNGGPNGRTTNDVGSNSAVILYNGRPHVFYYDSTTDALRHGYWNGLFWAFETLDGNGGPNGRTTNDVGLHTAAILYDGRPHVFYHDLTGGNLRHAYWNGFFWSFEILDGAGGPNGRINGDVGEYNALILYNGRPHVFYYSGLGIDLRHGYWNGLFWAFETLDGNGGPNGRTSSGVGWYNAAVLDDGTPRVFYQDLSNQDLRQAYYTGSAWGFETLDGHQNGPNGQLDTALGIDNTVVVYDGGPHVFHLRSTGLDLRHAYFG